MQRVIALLKNLKINTDFFAVYSSVGFLILIALVSNTKWFFICAFSYFLFLSLKYSLAKALIYVMPILSYIGVGQVHRILVIPAEKILSKQYLEGQQLIWTITPYFIISLTSLILFYFWQKKLKKKAKLLVHEKLVIIMSGFGVLSSIYSSFMPLFSIYGIIFTLVQMIWVIYFLNIGENYKKQSWSKIINTLIIVIATLIFYETTIVLFQMIFQGTVGLMIESTQFSPIFGLGAEESIGNFRPFGLNQHPNKLAYQHMSLMFSILFLWIYSKENLRINFKKIKLEKIILIAVISSFIVLILSLSRAAYISIIFAIIVYLSKFPKEFSRAKKLIKNFLQKIKGEYKIIIFFILAVLFFKTSTRIINSIYSFTENGGVNTRLTQYEESLKVFIKSPILGIGNQMFIPMSYQLFPKGVMQYFPENVHNSFLLLMTEYGLVGLVLYLAIIILLLKQIKISMIKNQAKTMLYCGIGGQLVFMLFHPERNLFSLTILIGIVIAHYERLQKKINKKG